MKILSRYILREATEFFLISLIAFTGMLLTLRMLKFASLVINKGVEVSQIINVALAIIPTFLEIALPLATLLGVMLALGRLSGDSEVIVLRSSGISLFQLITPVLLFGIFTGVLSLFVTLKLTPWGYQKLSKTLFDIARTKSTAGLDQGIFNKLGLLTFYAEKIDHQSGAVERILIDDKRDKSVRKIISAKTGSILSDDGNRTIVIFLKDGSIHELVDGKYVLTDYEKNRIVMTPDELHDPGAQKKGKAPREMLLPEVRRNITDLSLLLENAGSGEIKISNPEAISGLPTTPTPAEITKKIAKLKIETVRRFAMPFASFALAFVGMTLGIHPPRTQKKWGGGLSAVLGMAVFVFYYAMLSFGIALAENSIVVPAIAVWLPNILAVAIAFYCLWNLSTERWDSVVHGVDRLVSSLKMTVP